MPQKTLKDIFVEKFGTADFRQVFGQDILSGVETVRHWAISHGFSHPDRFIRIIPPDLWAELEPLQKQARCTMYRASKRVAELRKYGVSSIEELLTPEVLEGRVSIRLRLRQLGIDPSNIGDWISHNIPKQLLDKLSPMQANLSKKEAQAKNLELFGSISPFGSQAVRDKSKATLLARYGVSKVGKIPGIQAKRDATNILRYGSKSHRALLPDEIIRRLDIQDLDPLITIDRPSYEYSTISVRCRCCGREFETRLLSTQRSGTHFNAFKCCECKTHGTQLQDFVTEYIRSLGYSCEQIRPKWLVSPKSGSPLEIDCYIDELKMGFEIDGYFTHNSDENKYGDDPKDKGFHAYKTSCCLSNGVKLYHIWHYKCAPTDKDTAKAIVDLAIGVEAHGLLPELNEDFTVSRDICPDPSIFKAPYVDLGPQQFTDPEGRTCYTSGEWKFDFSSL